MECAGLRIFLRSVARRSRISVEHRAAGDFTHHLDPELEGQAMSAERWRRIEKIFHDALEQEPHSRALFLDQACADDPSLREEVEALIQSHEEAGNFLNAPTP